jgi:hypothetical protein
MYLVGEAGPELFARGMSGSIVPNAALRGHTIINKPDARGASNAAEVEVRVNRAIREAVSGIVQLAGQRASERSLRS